MIPADHHHSNVCQCGEGDTGGPDPSSPARFNGAPLRFMMSRTFPYVFAMFRLYSDTFAACTCTVPDLSFEPACDAEMLFVIVTASHEMGASQHNGYVSRRGRRPVRTDGAYCCRGRILGSSFDHILGHYPA